jgi:4-alpha-glucanotransferase
MITERSSGILLHPTSLPGALGTGDFGSEAYRFVDWLVSAGQHYWQILPMGEVGPGNSPYMSSSTFAGNILLIDLAELASHGWLIQEDLIPHPKFSADHVDFSILKPFRIERLRRAATNFFEQRRNKLHKEFNQFCAHESAWLEDYALFMTIAASEHGRVWSEWPVELASRNRQALHRIEKSCSGEINFWKFCQWCFARQWSTLKRYANERGVQIVGDVPIFVAYQSADVWSHQELFELDQQGRPLAVAGVPPDYFSETGQLWGNPLYRWNVHKETGFAWWIARLRHALVQTDWVRIDHFRGFAAYWEVPADAPNAIPGRWVQGPGAALFEAFQQNFPELPIIAEDLGLITPDVIALRDQFNLPGMRILQFAFGDSDANLFLPHHYIANTVAYTGTHDNNTTLGWWNTAAPHEKEFAQRYLHTNEVGIHLVMMRAISNSPANLVIFPMQDVLGLGGESRMNFPGHPTGNWEWRFTWQQIQTENTRVLEEMAVNSGR